MVVFGEEGSKVVESAFFCFLRTGREKEDDRCRPAFGVSVAARGDEERRATIEETRDDASDGGGSR